MAAGDFALDFAHADTGGVRQAGESLDPEPMAAVGSAADGTGAGAVACRLPIPGCQAFIAAVDRATMAIAEFATTAEEGLRTYTTIAVTGAPGYETTDSASAALIRGTAGGSLLNGV